MRLWWVWTNNEIYGVHLLSWRCCFSLNIILVFLYIYSFTNQCLSNTWHVDTGSHGLVISKCSSSSMFNPFTLFQLVLHDQMEIRHTISCLNLQNWHWGSISSILQVKMVYRVRVDNSTGYSISLSIYFSSSIKIGINVFTPKPSSLKWSLS
jgi:hypothetical protein